MTKANGNQKTESIKNRVGSDLAYYSRFLTGLGAFLFFLTSIEWAFGPLNSTNYFVRILVYAWGFLGQYLIFGPKFFPQGNLLKVIGIRDRIVKLYGHEIGMADKSEPDLADLRAYLLPVMFTAATGGLLFYALFNSELLRPGFDYSAAIVAISIVFTRDPSRIWISPLAALICLFAGGLPHDFGLMRGILYLVLVSIALVAICRFLRKEDFLAAGAANSGLPIRVWQDSNLIRIFLFSSIFGGLIFFASKEDSSRPKLRPKRAPVTSSNATQAPGSSPVENAEQSISSEGDNNSESGDGAVGGAGEGSEQTNEFQKPAGDSEFSSQLTPESGAKANSGNQLREQAQDLKSVIRSQAGKGGESGALEDVRKGGSDPASRASSGSQNAGSIGYSGPKNGNASGAKSSGGKPKSEGGNFRAGKPKSVVNDKKFEIPELKAKLRSIGIVVFLIAVFSMIFFLGKKKGGFKKQVGKSAKELNDEAYRAIEKIMSETASFKNIEHPTPEKMRKEVVYLYNLLLQANEKQGFARPVHFTPDEYQVRYSAVAPDKVAAMSTVTDVYSKVFYGNCFPDREIFGRYLDAVGFAVLRQRISAVNS